MVLLRALIPIDVMCFLEKVSQQTAGRGKTTPLPPATGESSWRKRVQGAGSATLWLLPLCLPESIISIPLIPTLLLAASALLV